MFPFPPFGKEPENPERKCSAALLQGGRCSDAGGMGMESGIGQPLRQRYVVVRYISGEAGQEQRTELLLLVEDGGTLKIHIKEGWESGFEPAEREYLRELMKDWRDASGDRVDAVLDELAELSVGPLRTVEAGVADAGKLARLMEPFA